MKKLKMFIATFMLIAMGAFASLPATPVGAAALDGVCANNADSAVCQNKNDSSDSLVNTLVNVLLFIVGALAVLMIIVGGIMYATSQGDSGNITKAKNTVLYSVVGLVVAILAFAIVNWVFRQF